MEKKTSIKGHNVLHDENVSGGVYFLLNQINTQEAKVFFDQACNHGHAIFEDHNGHKYKLTYHGGEYQLDKA